MKHSALFLGHQDKQRQSIGAGSRSIKSYDSSLERGAALGS